MGFGTEFQMGNRMGGTMLSDLFRNNIGAPLPPSTIQRPTRLVDLIQNLLGKKSPMNEIQSSMPQIGPTPLSAVTAENAFSRDVMPKPRMETNMMPPSLTNPFANLINQRFIR